MRLRFTPLVILALSLPLAGCGGGMLGGGFDPTDLLNFLDTEKPLPGERKAVFPEGVPGVDRGVPPEMMRGSAASAAAREQVEQSRQPQLTQQPQPQQPAQTEAAIASPETNVEEPPPRVAAPRPKGPPAKRRSLTAPEAAAEPAPAPAPRQQAAPVQQAAPAPQQQQSVFPSPFSQQPMQSGTFQKQ